MRQRSNLIILFGIAFFLVGGAIVFLVLNDDDDGGGGRSGSSAGIAEVTVLVAGADIEANTLGSDVIANGLLTTETVPAGTQPAGALTTPAGLENQIFALPVEEGAIITQAQLVTRSLSNVQVPEGFEAVAVTVSSTNGGAGYIAPGDLVNIYGLYGEGSSDAGREAALRGAPEPLPRTELALTNVLVLDVSSQAGTSVQSTSPDSNTTNRQGAANSLTYLFALRTNDVERVVQLTTFADIYLTLTADDAPPTGDTPGVSGENVGDPVSADSAPPQS